MAEWYDPEYVDDGDPFRSSLQQIKRQPSRIDRGDFLLQVADRIPDGAACPLCRVTVGRGNNYSAHLGSSQHTQLYLLELSRRGPEDFFTSYGSVPYPDPPSGTNGWSPFQEKDPFMVYAIRCGFYTGFECKACVKQCSNLDDYRRHLCTDEHNHRTRYRSTEIGIENYRKMHFDVPSFCQERLYKDRTSLVFPTPGSTVPSERGDTMRKTVTEHDRKNTPQAGITGVSPTQMPSNRDQYGYNHKQQSTEQRSVDFHRKRSFQPNALEPSFEKRPRSSEERGDASKLLSASGIEMTDLKTILSSATTKSSDSYIMSNLEQKIQQYAPNLTFPGQQNAQVIHASGFADRHSSISNPTDKNTQPKANEMQQTLPFRQGLTKQQPSNEPMATVKYLKDRVFHIAQRPDTGLEQRTLMLQMTDLLEKQDVSIQEIKIEKEQLEKDMQKQKDMDERDRRHKREREDRERRERKEKDDMLKRDMNKERKEFEQLKRDLDLQSRLIQGYDKTKQEVKDIRNAIDKIKGEKKKLTRDFDEEKEKFKKLQKEKNEQNKKQADELKVAKQETVAQKSIIAKLLSQLQEQKLLIKKQTEIKQDTSIIDLTTKSDKLDIATNIVSRQKELPFGTGVSRSTDQDFRKELANVSLKHSQDKDLRAVGPGKPWGTSKMDSKQQNKDEVDTTHMGDSAADVEDQKLFIKPISEQWSESDLIQFFKGFGTVLSGAVFSRTRGKSFGFVKLSSYEQCWNAINALNGFVLPGADKAAVVRFALKENKKTDNKQNIKEDHGIKNPKDNLKVTPMDLDDEVVENAGDSILKNKAPSLLDLARTTSNTNTVERTRGDEGIPSDTKILLASSGITDPLKLKQLVDLVSEMNTETMQVLAAKDVNILDQLGSINPDMLMEISSSIPGLNQTLERINFNAFIDLLRSVGATALRAVIQLCAENYNVVGELKKMLSASRQSGPSPSGPPIRETQGDQERKLSPSRGGQQGPPKHHNDVDIRRQQPPTRRPPGNNWSYDRQSHDRRHNDWGDRRSPPRYGARR